MTRKKRPNRLRVIRLVIEWILFIGFILLLSDPTGWLQHILGWLPKTQWMPAALNLSVVLLLLIILTALFGRVYCSMLCPLGAMQDGFSWIGQKLRKSGHIYHTEYKWLRYTVMVLFILMLLWPSTAWLSRLIEPYSMFGRIVVAAARHAWNVTFWIGAATFVILALWAQLRGREYCNTICPVGTMLSLVSRFAIFRPTIDEQKCTNCGTCGRKCKANAIDTHNHKIDMAQCVGCFNCLTDCKQGAIDLTATNPKQQ